MDFVRTPWREGFPDVVVHTTVRVRDAHPDYLAAKSGQRAAATRLARDLLPDSAVELVREALAGATPTLAPVRAIETTGINLIPDAMAHYLGGRLGLPVVTTFVQTNTVSHTRASGFHRLAFQPTFAGATAPGESYFLVDDHVGLGSTLANLRGHIEDEGGSVVGSTTLTASRDSQRIALRLATLHALRERHGDSLESYWSEQLGFGVDRLTEAEAGYLLRTASLDAIRAGMAAARGG